MNRKEKGQEKINPKKLNKNNERIRNKKMRENTEKEKEGYG